MNDISNRLAAVRTALGETQKSMSERLGLGQSTWQTYERDGRLPKTESLEQLAALGFSIDWIVTGSGSMRVGQDFAQIERAEQIYERLEQVASALSIPPPLTLDLPNILDLGSRGVDVHWLITGQGAMLWGAPSETEPYSKHEVNENLLAGVISAVVGQAHRQNQPLTPQQLGMTVAKVYAEQAAKTEAQVAREVAALGAGPINRTKP